MKVIKVEVDVTMPDSMDDKTVTNAVDHIVDAGAADMALEIYAGAQSPLIVPAVAEDCVQIDIGDAKVVGGSEN